jgi:hypothetical protein
LTAEQVYAKASPSVWRVVTYDLDNLPLGQAQAAANAVGGQSDGAAVLRPAATTDDLQGLIGK